MHQTEIFVAYQGGAYVTSTVHGQRASCTMRAMEAATRLAGKLYGDTLRSVVETTAPQVQFTRRYLARGEALQVPERKPRGARAKLVETTDE